MEPTEAFAEQIKKVDDATLTERLFHAPKENILAIAQEIVARADAANARKAAAREAIDAANLRMSEMLQKANLDNMRLANENTRLHQECVRNERRIQESHAVISHLAELVQDLFQRIS
jgi:membrane-bound ClpP family serine protease